MNAVTHRRGFTLTELLVSVAIILVLVSLIGAGVASTRGSQKATDTRAVLAALSRLLDSQLAKYSALSSSGAASGMSASGYRAWSIRRNRITAELPDRWTDVEYMYNNSDLYLAIANPQFPKAQLTPPQRAYLATWNNLVSAGQTSTVKADIPSASAECLFMIIMQSGLIEPPDLESLRSARIGDKDADGMPEFLDAWGNPIGFILWPAGFEIPSRPGQLLFTGSRALVPPFFGEDANQNGTLDSGEDLNQNGLLDTPSPSLGMRPVIYSAGPDGAHGLNRGDEIAQLNLNSTASSPVGRDCGNWQVAPTSSMGGPISGSYAHRDNITSLDSEAQQ